MHTTRLTRLFLAAAAAVALYGCSWSKQEAKWELRDKPADMRVPQSGETDPADGISEQK